MRDTLDDLEVQDSEPVAQPDEGEQNTDADADADAEPIDVDDEEGDEEGDASAAQPDVEPGVNEARYLSEKEIEKRMNRMYGENERHRKRVSEIMEEDATALVPCPVCMDAFHGWIFDPSHAPLAPEQKERTLQLLGIAEFEEIPSAPWAQTCQDCNGYGKVKTGSKREGREITGCLTCNEAGWINRSGAPAANGNGTDPDKAPVTGPTVYGLEPDPRIAALQGEGYTVIRPFVPNG